MRTVFPERGTVFIAYFVRCGNRACNLGEGDGVEGVPGRTKREAEREARDLGWRRRGGRWYCDYHYYFPDEVAR